jgi:transcriptional regulator with XRE-family HTH domain
MADSPIAIDRSTFAPQIASAVRHARHLIGWSQRELAGRAKTSHTTIWRLESGHLDAFDLLVVERVLTSLGIHAQLSLGTRHLEDRRRQADGVHARVNGFVGRRLREHAFDVATEVIIGAGSPRGWIDTLAFRSADRALVVEETKTEIDDLGGLQRSVAFYEREAVGVARSLGWSPRRVVVIVAVLDTASVARHLRDSHEAAASAFPANVEATRAWLRNPRAAPPRGWTIGAVDPASRREDWLLPTSLTSRRRPVYANYRDAARRLLHA